MFSVGENIVVLGGRYSMKVDYLVGMPGIVLSVDPITRNALVEFENEERRWVDLLALCSNRGAADVSAAGLS